MTWIERFLIAVIWLCVLTVMGLMLWYVIPWYIQWAITQPSINSY